MPSTTTDTKEGWSDQMLAKEEAQQAFKSSGRTTRSSNKKATLPSLRIPAAPKKSTVRLTFEEKDEPSTPSPKPVESAKRSKRTSRFISVRNDLFIYCLY